MEIDKIYLGDCLELMKEIPDNSIDLVLTDPPYRVTPKGSYGTMSGCIPITVWYVQKYINICFVYAGWVNIKGYDSYDKAKRLLHILNGKEKL